MKNPKIKFAVFAVIFALCVIALLVYWVTKEPSEEPHIADTTVTEPPTEAITEPQTEPVTTPEPTSRPVIDLDEGNEIYLDSNVVAALTQMEAEGEEDLVNAILDGEILLINHFVKVGYTKEAICQIQRFYYDFYDQLKAEPIETTITKVGLCIPTEGSTLEGFADTVQTEFGWGREWNFDYVIGTEGAV